MARTLAKGEKPLDWVGSSKKDFLGFPEPVKDEMGNALGLAQFGGKHPSASPCKGRGPGVFGIVEDYDGDTYRAVYTVRFTEVVYVLHAFQKKSPKGDRHGTGRHRPCGATVEDRTTGLRGPPWQVETLKR